MDLAKYNLTAKAEGGYTLTVRDPYTGKDTDIVIGVIGSDSKTYRAAKTESYRMAAAGADELEISAVVYAKCVTSMEGIEEDGKPVEFTVENVVELFTKYPWLMDQVAVAVETRSNFTKEPAKS